MIQRGRASLVLSRSGLFSFAPRLVRQRAVAVAPLGGMPDCFGDEPSGMLECRFDVEAAGHPDGECRREGVPGSMHGIRLPLRLQPRDLASINQQSAATSPLACPPVTTTCVGPRSSWIIRAARSASSRLQTFISTSSAASGRLGVMTVACPMNWRMAATASGEGSASPRRVVMTGSTTSGPASSCWIASVTASIRSASNSMPVFVAAGGTSCTTRSNWRTTKPEGTR